MTKTLYGIDTYFVESKKSDANESVLKSYYNENQDKYKGSDDKIKPFNEVKAEVNKDYNIEQSKTNALEKYVAVKKAELATNGFISVNEDNATFLLDEIKGAKVGEVIKPFIYKDGYLVYRTLVSILPDSRLNFTFSTNVGLYLEETIRLRNTRDEGSNSNYRVVFTESEFSLFLKKLNEQAKFDDEKIAYINQQLITTNFTAGQVKRLVEILSFSKLEVAKKLYDYCIDPQNYFVVFDAFSFSDEKNALSDYITKQIH